MTVVVFDTIREVTTVTVRENEAGDTIKVVQITDLSHTSTKDRYHDVKEKVIVKTDTVYVERKSDKQAVVAAGSNVEIDKEGNVTRHVNRLAQTLKWICFAALALALLIIVIRIFLLKR